MAKAEASTSPVSLHKTSVTHQGANPPTGLTVAAIFVDYAVKWELIDRITGVEKHTVPTLHVGASIAFGSQSSK